MSDVGQIVKDVEIMHQGLIFKFQIKLMSSDVPPSPPAEQTLDELKIVHADNKEGDNTFDLGGIQQVGELYVRFKKDAQDKNESFEISLSEDGKNWLAKLTGEQQEQSAVSLLITPFFNAKYVKFVAQRKLNTIEYVKISGKKLSEPIKEEPIEVAQPEPEIPEIEKSPGQPGESIPKDEVDFEATKALEDAKKVAEEAEDPKDKKEAQDTLKKSKKK
jgi:hypothetical protein